MDAMNLTGEAVYLLIVHRPQQMTPTTEAFADAFEAIKAARSVEAGECADRVPASQEYAEGTIYRGEFYNRAAMEVRRVIVQ